MNKAIELLRANLPVLRHLLQFLAGILVTAGFMSSDQSTQAIDLTMQIAGPGLGLITMVWMVVEKKKAQVPPAPVVVAALLALSLGAGCARFQTKQTDISYDTNNVPTRTITTKVSAYTFFESESKLSQFKATQTDKSQSASVGSLDQSAGSTNTVAALNAIVQILGAVK
jgi:hypothetical protein